MRIRNEDDKIVRGKWDKKMQIRILGLLFLDIFLILISMVGALWIRFDFHFMEIDQRFMESIWEYLPINIICTLILYEFFRLYTSLWRFAGIVELKHIGFATVSATLLQSLGMALMKLPIPRSYPFIYLLILTILTVGSRYSYRFLRISMHNMQNKRQNEPVRTMIVGAGAAGYMIVSEMQNSKHLNREIPCIIDDDASKRGTYLRGVRVMGNKEQIPYYAEKFDIEEIVIAIPTLSNNSKKELLNICQQTGCKILILPGIYQLVNEDVSVSMLRKVGIEDLLGREPVNLKMDEAMNYIRNKVILVTGGGGSIGSEICRQIALHQPKLLIILDIYENNAYDIQNELKEKHPNVKCQVLIGSVRNKKRIDNIFEEYRPELVFHAAAHKHVPLMEDSPCEAVKNNVMGTWIVAEAAHTYKARKMVLISTDKAVRPTNIMGASKRICELIVQSFAQKSRTEFAAVRFGNVLGSNGSVVPLFRKQIEAGGPVTVTHPQIIRYFMTIPEAVNLVLQCGTLARGGEIFILDMGEPVKILDLTKKMIRLSGFEPGKDMKIEFIGLRPGEKLYEELLISESNLKKTDIDRIFVAQQVHVNGEEIQMKVENLIESAFAEDTDIRKKVQELVPEYVIKEKNASATA